MGPQDIKIRLPSPETRLRAPGNEVTRPEIRVRARRARRGACERSSQHELGLWMFRCRANMAHKIVWPCQSDKTLETFQVLLSSLDSYMDGVCDVAAMCEVEDGLDWMQ